MNLSERKEHAERIEKAVAYACGFVESWLQSYAAGINVPTSYLTSRVGQLFHSTEDGIVLRPDNNLSSLQRKASKANQVWEPEVAVASRPHRRSQTNKSHVTGPKSYWAKMTPEERKVEMKKRYAKRGILKKIVTPIQDIPFPKKYTTRKYKPYLHWTQKPKNKARLAKIIRKMNKRRLGK